MGCEIGNHSMNHVNLRNVSADAVHRQIASANAAIAAITGVTPHSIRPPFGEVNNNVRNMAAGLGMPIVMWSVDPLDWLTTSSQTTYSRVMEKVQDGDVILLHDTHASTVRATAMLIPALLDKGFQLVTVSELFHYKEIEPVLGIVYGAIR